MDININQVIRAEREKRRYSQVDIAGMLKISPSAYLQIEKGKTELTLSRLTQIASVLNVSVSYLLQTGGVIESRESTIVKALKKENENFKRINEGYRLLNIEYLNKLEKLYFGRVQFIQSSIIETALVYNIISVEKCKEWILIEHDIDNKSLPFFIDMDFISIESKGLNSKDFLLSNFMSESEIFESLSFWYMPVIEDLRILYGFNLITDEGLKRSFEKLLLEKPITGIVKPIRTNQNIS
jgi:transcriptional regulator with XRE-family HTH domain